MRIHHLSRGGKYLISGRLVANSTPQLRLFCAHDRAQFESFAAPAPSTGLAPFASPRAATPIAVNQLPL